MLMNNLGRDVVERWQDLIVYDGSEKAARPRRLIPTTRYPPKTTVPKHRYSCG